MKMSFTPLQNTILPNTKVMLGFVVLVLHPYKIQYSQTQGSMLRSFFVFYTLIKIQCSQTKF